MVERTSCLNLFVPFVSPFDFSLFLFLMSGFTFCRGGRIQVALMPLASLDWKTLSPLSFVDPSTRTSVGITNLSVSLPSLVQSLSPVDIIKCSTMYPSCLPHHLACGDNLFRTIWYHVKRFFRKEGRGDSALFRFSPRPFRNAERPWGTSFQELRYLIVETRDSQFARIPRLTHTLQKPPGILPVLTYAEVIYEGRGAYWRFSSVRH